MSLAEQLVNQISDSTLSYNERAQLRCQLSKELEEAGDYEGAREAMGNLWHRVGDGPNLTGLDQATAAEVLLCAGLLTSCIGSAKRINNAQEMAKDLISRSIRVFEALQEKRKITEALTSLAVCYWRGGALDDARDILNDALTRLSSEDDPQRAIILLRIALVESSATRFSDALRKFNEAAPLFENKKEVLKGKFHHEFGTLLKNLGAAEHREDYVDRALVEFAAASIHFEQARTPRFHACVENNLGMLFFKALRFAEAHNHLDRARRLFVNLKDYLHIAQVDETRGRVLLAEGKNVEAERVARGAVEVLENGGEQSLWVEALTTRGTALARLGKYRKAREDFERAIEVGVRAGDGEKAGLATLALIEELGDRLEREELREVALRAEELLEKSQDASIVRRLNSCLCWALRTMQGKRYGHQSVSSQSREKAKDVSIQSEEAVVEESETKGSWSWEGFSLWEDVRRYEERVIGRALRDAGGVVSRAAQMLGFKHHNSLIALLNTRHKNLLHARSPIIPRRRSIVRGGQAAGRKVTAAAKGAERSVSVLHVEDNAIVADAVRETLEVEGWRVEGCADGAEALKLVESAARFDLLLVDCELPGVNGVEIVRAARRLAHRRETPIIILSASDCVMEAHRAGANVFLRKPEDMHALVETIAHLLNVGFKQH